MLRQYQFFFQISFVILKSLRRKFKSHLSRSNASNYHYSCSFTMFTGIKMHDTFSSQALQQMQMLLCPSYFSPVQPMNIHMPGLSHSFGFSLNPQCKFIVSSLPDKYQLPEPRHLAYVHTSWALFISPKQHSISSHWLVFWRRYKTAHVQLIGLYHEKDNMPDALPCTCNVIHLSIIASQCINWQY